MLLAAALLASGCGNSPKAPSLTETAPTGPVGTIRGVVHLMGNAPAADSAAITVDQATCGSSVLLPRIALGKDNGVKDTFVFLDGAPAVPNAPPAVPASVLVDQQHCQYVPHAMTVPVGAELEITNSDAILHNVHGYLNAQQDAQSLFSISQPIKGQHGKTPALTKPGIVSLTCDAGHPWMTAYVYVSENPYVAITKDNGDFVIANVPPGTYKIKMWHEGVTLKSSDKKAKTYEYEDPYETMQDVTVTANNEVTVNFDLALRSAKK